MNSVPSSGDRQYATLDDFLQAEMGIGPGVFLLDDAQKKSLEGVSLLKKQEVLVNFLMNKLRSADAFASPSEDESNYMAKFRVHPHTAPEWFKHVPSSFAQFDMTASRPKIFRNPWLFSQYFEPGEVLFAHLQGALRWSYLQQSGRRQFSLEVDIDIMERLISFAHECGFPEGGVVHLSTCLSELKARSLSPSHDLPQ